MDPHVPGIYLKALRRALKLAGGKTALRERLNVPMARLEGWLDGEAEPPLEVFLRTVDLISAPPRQLAGERLLRLQQAQLQLTQLSDAVEASVTLPWQEHRA